MKNRSYSVDLIKQMAECDANYIRLLKLIPELRAFRNRTVVKDSYFSNSTKDHPGTRSTTIETAGKLGEFVIADNHEGSENTVIVEIRVIEFFKYTTTLEITQRPEGGEWLTNPTMQVRIYHDASTAEVTSYQNHRNFKPSYIQPNPKMYQRDEKMQVNKFLGEWLTLCLQVGRCLDVPDIAFN